MKKFIIALTKDAGNLALKFLKKNNKIFSKGKKGIVTEIDLKCEQMIINAIKKKFPSHSILTEEKLSQDNKSDYLWLIDPIDGTTNYSQQYPLFCVSVALAYQGNVKHGCVYSPVLDELFYAESGKGAFLNNKRISVSKKKRLNEAVFATGFAYDRGNIMWKNLKNMGNFLKERRTRGVKIDGSAALDLCYVACGRYDGFWEFNLQPWDIAAGYLIVKEAKGRVTSLDGREWGIGSGKIVASNNRLHNSMLKVIR